MDRENIVTLPSGAKLRIMDPDFEVSKQLYQAVLEDVRTIKFETKDQLENFIKDSVCVALSSKKVEEKILACAKVCLIDDQRFDLKYFQPRENRGDYIPAMLAIAEDNILPFMKDLFALCAPLLEKLKTLHG